MKIIFALQLLFTFVIMVLCLVCSNETGEHGVFVNGKSKSKKKCKKKVRLGNDQVIALWKSFNENPMPNTAARQVIADELNLSQRAVQIWFQNRRAKMKLQVGFLIYLYLFIYLLFLFVIEV